MISRLDFDGSAQKEIVPVLLAGMSRALIGTVESSDSTLKLCYSYVLLIEELVKEGYSKEKAKKAVDELSLIKFDGSSPAILKSLEL